VVAAMEKVEAIYGAAWIRGRLGDVASVVEHTLYRMNERQIATLPLILSEIANILLASSYNYYSTSVVEGLF
jgi:hypothetical protein